MVGLCPCCPCQGHSCPWATRPPTEPEGRSQQQDCVGSKPNCWLIQFLEDTKRFISCFPFPPLLNIGGKRAESKKRKATVGRGEQHKNTILSSLEAVSMPALWQWLQQGLPALQCTKVDLGVIFLHRWWGCCCWRPYCCWFLPLPLTDSPSSISESSSGNSCLSAQEASWFI